ncbi:MAG: T9SS type A sorting domain-containing protein [bacterium]|nr:T9SS type A sorting domain-containing protein [bacterium]
MAHYKGPGDCNAHPVGIAANNNGDVYLSGHSYTTNWSIISTIKYAYSEIGDDNIPIPDKYSLFQNYPNPFNPSTIIRFALPQQTKVKLQVFDLLGRDIALLLDEEMQPGEHQVECKLNHLANGVYIYRLSAGHFVQQRKMVLLK